LSADTIWRGLQAAGYLMIPMYAVGITFSLLLLLNLERVLESTPSSINLSGALQRVCGLLGLQSPFSKARLLSRRVRILLR
jgi:hypothetical protein